MNRTEFLKGHAAFFLVTSAILGTSGVLLTGCSDDGGDAECTTLFEEAAYVELYTLVSAECTSQGLFAIVPDEFEAEIEARDCFSQSSCSYDDECSVEALADPDLEFCMELGTTPGTNPTVCTGDEACGDYLCNDAQSSCFTSCTDGSECASAAQCEDSECIIPGGGSAAIYSLVALVSTASGESLFADNPGPDVDAISVLQGGSEVYAAGTLSSAVGSISGGDGATGSAQNLLGPPRATDGFGGECDLDASFNYFSFGGAGGFVAVSYPPNVEFARGSQVKVYELAGGPGGCSNISSDRPDTFDVYIGATGAAAPSTSADISSGADWCLIGSSPAVGGITTLSVSGCN
jgi:hypothetical protein